MAAAAMLSSSATAFAPVARPASKIVTVSSTSLQVLPSPADMGDLTALNHAAQDFFTSTSMVLSDAAGATVEAASEDGGWWQSYLQIFRNILVFVHDSVDGPLKSIGVENTWGISIALFTMSKCSSMCLLSNRKTRLVCIILR